MSEQRSRRAWLKTQTHCDSAWARVMDVDAPVGPRDVKYAIHNNDIRATVRDDRGGTHDVARAMDPGRGEML